MQHSFQLIPQILTSPFVLNPHILRLFLVFSFQLDPIYFSFPLEELLEQQQSPPVLLADDDAAIEVSSNGAEAFDER